MSARAPALRVLSYLPNPRLAKAPIADASLAFAPDVQVYLLKLAGGLVKAPTHERARAARDAYPAGIEQALAPGRAFLVGDALTLCAHEAFAPDLGPYLETLDARDD